MRMRRMRMRRRRRRGGHGVEQRRNLAAVRERRRRRLERTARVQLRLVGGWKQRRAGPRIWSLDRWKRGRSARARRKRHERIRWPGVAGLWAQRRRERGVPVGGKWRGHAEERRGDIDSYGERRRGGRERSAGVQLRLV